jgi:outer membrane protein assembly factor BamB
MTRYHKDPILIRQNPFFRITLLPIFLLLATLLAGCASGGALAASSWPSLTVSGDEGYIAFNQAVHAIDLTRGTELWRFPIEPNRTMTFYAPPTLAEEDLIIVGGYDKFVYALDFSGGGDIQSRWVFEGAGDRIIGGAVSTADVVLVPSADNNLYALDITTGEPVWAEPFNTTEALWSAPLVDQDVIYIASLDHRIYALDVSSGRERWQSEDLQGAVADTPVLEDGLLLVGTFGSQLVALDVESRGQVKWTFDTEGWVWSSPAINAGVAYLGDTVGVAYAIDLESGQEIWRKTLDGPIAAKPALSESGVYFVTESGTVYAFELGSHQPLWPSNPNLNGKLLSDPIPYDDSLLVPAMESECLIHAVDLTSGAVRCLFQPTN